MLQRALSLFCIFMVFVQSGTCYIFPFLFDDQKADIKRSAAANHTTTTHEGHGNSTTTVIHSSTHPTKLPSCDDDKLMVYLADIQAINPEAIINLSTLQDLDALCSKVSDNLDAIDDFLKTCEPAQQKDLYIQLIKGVDSLYQKLCTDGTFRTDFEKHFHCIKDLHTEYEDCSGPADWTEDMSKENVCKAYQNIIDCYFVKTANVCGKNAAHIMRELSKAIVSSVLTHDCGKLQVEPKLGPEIPDEIQEEGGVYPALNGKTKKNAKAPEFGKTLKILMILFTVLFLYEL